MAKEPAIDTPSGWRTDVFSVLKRHDISHVAYVPDAGHAAAIEMAVADPAIASVALTTARC